MTASPPLNYPVRAQLAEHARLNARLRPLLTDLAARVPDRGTNNPAGTPYFSNKWLSDRELSRRPEPEIGELVKAIESHVLRHEWPGAPANEPLSVYAMWAIVSRPGMEGVVHSHNGLVSGAYYVDAGDSGADFGGDFTIHGPGGETLQKITPVAGQLLLFPSTLRHGVERYTGKRPRIVVSFNLRASSDTRPDHRLDR